MPVFPLQFRNFGAALYNKRAIFQALSSSLSTSGCFVRFDTTCQPVMYCLVPLFSEKSAMEQKPNWSAKRVYGIITYYDNSNSFELTLSYIALRLIITVYQF